MVDIDRRRFLGLAGGAAALTMLDQSIARAAAIPAARRTGTLKDIEHVVVLMQENRSFEHYLGTLRGVRGFGDPHPAILPSGNPVWHQPNGPDTTGTLLPFHPEVDDLGAAFLEGLPHSWTDGQQAINRGRYDQLNKDSFNGVAFSVLRYPCHFKPFSFVSSSYLSLSISTQSLIGISQSPIPLSFYYFILDFVIPGADLGGDCTGSSDLVTYLQSTVNFRVC